MSQPLTLGLCVLLGSGCLTPLQVKKERVISARQVAIIGFTGIVDLGEDQPRESLWEVVSSSTADRDELARRRTRREAQAGAVYEALRQRLTHELGWEVLSPEALASSAPVQQLTTAPALHQQLAAVPPHAKVNGLEARARGELARELGVDGLISVELRYRVGHAEGFKVVGLGTISRRPVATTHLKMFDAEGELVWEDREARGKTTAGSLGNPAPDVDEESALMIEAAQSSFDELFGRLSRAE